ncbi:MAG: VCBS repeat-containing protein [Planctomycetota bacterium]
MLARSLAPLLLLPAVSAQDVFLERQLTTVLLDPVDAFGIDFDGDSDEDVVGISGGDGGILVLENLGGTQFVQRLGLIGPEPDVARGDAFDLDGDGRQDLVFATADELVLWRNEGPATPWTRSVLDVGSFGVGTVFDAEDLNGDGVLDLVVRFPNEAGWLPSLGGGAIGTYARIAPTATRGLQLVDVDGNGVRDLVTVRSGPVTRWWEADGAGGFTPLTSNHGFAAGTFADIDGDGVTDELAFEQEDFVGFGSYANYIGHWRRGLGAGQYAPSVNIGYIASQLCLFSGQLPIDVVVDALPDHSGDGLPELLIDCRCQQPEPRDIAEVISTGPTAWAPPNYWTARNRLADVDDDGDRDALMPVSRIRWRRLQPSGMYENGGLLVDGVEVGDGERPDVGDLDRDGWPDLMATPRDGRAIAVFDGLGNGSFSPPRVEGTASSPFFIDRRRHLADLDGNGTLDVAYAVEDQLGVIWRRGDGAGSFGPPLRIANTTAQPRIGGTALVDIDGDGDIDVLGADTFRALVLWRGDGAGGFLPQEDFLDPTMRTHFEVGDLEGDGDLDVVSYDYLFPSTGLTIHEWTGSGFAAPFNVPTTRTWEVALADLDDDGDLDAAFVGDQMLSWVRNDHPNGWSAGAGLVLPQPLLPESIAAGDVDGDGDDDLVVVGEDPATGAGAVVLFRQEATGVVADPAQPIASILRGLELADVDADGDLDAVGAEASAVVWLENLIDHERPIGEQICTSAIPNSTGSPAAIRARGSVQLTLRDVTLRVSSLPQNASGYFLTSQTQASVFPVSNSQGRLCLGGAIGRYVGPGQVQNSGSEGTYELVVNLSAMPTPNGPALALPGSTWTFQAWYRDANPTSTSNFTDAVVLTFE